MDFGFWILDFGFWILDFGSWILDFGFWILDFGFWISDFGFWILDVGSWILDFGFWIVVVSVLFVAAPNAAVWILDFGFWILDLGFWILDFGFWILDFGSWILDFGFWILDFGFRILDFGFWILGTVWILHKIIATTRRLGSADSQYNNIYIYIDRYVLLCPRFKIFRQTAVTCMFNDDVGFEGCIWMHPPFYFPCRVHRHFPGTEQEAARCRYKNQIRAVTLQYEVLKTEKLRRTGLTNQCF